MCVVCLFECVVSIENPYQITCQIQQSEQEETEELRLPFALPQLHRPRSFNTRR